MIEPENKTIPVKAPCDLVAVVDWYRREVLSWRKSNTLDAAFCAEALNNVFVERFWRSLKYENIGESESA